MINLRKILGLEFYVSELDRFMADFDRTHPKLSTSQRKQKEKYQRINQLRDYPISEQHDEFWDKF